jgi:hypothetical protein
MVGLSGYLCHGKAVTAVLAWQCCHGKAGKAVL